MVIPEHTQTALENYIIHGFTPGGFLESVLSNDLYGAVGRADHWNKQCIPAIVQWVLENAPSDCHGNRMLVAQWTGDVDGRRSQYVKHLEKTLIWKTLAEEDNA